MEEKSIKRSRSSNIKSIPLTATDIALEKIATLIAKKKNIIGIKVGIKKGGCAGYQYKLSYVEDISASDMLVEMAYKEQKISIFIDPSAILVIFGSQIDYIKTDLKQGFVFNNPNKKGECGCGESFNA